MNGEAFLSLLQFSDGLFPAGSYAHSFGLETYAAEGTIRDAEGVERFLLSYLAGFCRAHRCRLRTCFAEGGGSLPSRRENGTVCRSSTSSLDAMKPVSELRDASRQMGRQVLRIAAQHGRARCLAGIDGGPV